MYTQKDIHTCIHTHSSAITGQVEDNGLLPGFIKLAYKMLI